jgi:two-component system response regulator HydG
VSGSIFFGPHGRPGARAAARGGPAAPRARVLVVDDEAAVRYTLRAILEAGADEGLAAVEVLEAADGEAALGIIESQRVDLVLSDLRMPRLDGLGLLDALAARGGQPPLILVTAHGSERTAVVAMQKGALDYFAKPFDPDEVVRVVRRSLATARLEEEVQDLRAQIALSRTMVFTSRAMQRVARLVERVAPRDVTVLVTGASGTGKERIAEAIVAASPRAQRPFVRFNCAALPRELAEAELFGHSRGAFTGATRVRPGLFREADGGTLLLDEVSELDPLIQGSLLRVLQEREVRPVGEDRAVPIDVRLLAATNRELGAEVARGRFREDLFYRLNVVVIHVPPLSERPEDVQPLAEHFVHRFGQRFGVPDARLSPRTLDRLRAHAWPGNVRELENTIERLVALAPGPLVDEDPFAQDGGAQAAPPPMTLRERVAAFERGLVAEELARCQGNQSEAARRLGVSRVTLIDKLKRYGLTGTGE